MNLQHNICHKGVFTRSVFKLIINNAAFFNHHCVYEKRGVINNELQNATCKHSLKHDTVRLYWHTVLPSGLLTFEEIVKHQLGYYPSMQVK